ncbi:recombinase family protein [Thermodesulfobacteriota bacterium]
MSTEDQAREGISLDNQKSKIMAYCNLKDLDLIEIIADAGISAKNLNRSGAHKVLEMSRKKQVDAVVVYKLDRMFRSTVDALETTRKFDNWGVSFHSIQETLDSKSAMGRFFFTLTAALAEMERGIIGERTKAALSHKRAMNEKTGGDVPYGYELDKTEHLVENKAEQKAIRLILDLKDKGYSLRAIGLELEEEGYRTRRNKTKWHPQTINQILKSQILKKAA